MNKKYVMIKLDIEQIKEFYAAAITFMGDIDLCQGRYVVDGKSLMGVYTLSLSNPITAVLNSEDLEEHSRFEKVMGQFSYEKN